MLMSSGRRRRSRLDRFVQMAASLGLGTEDVFAWVAARAPAERVRAQLHDRDSGRRSLRAGSSGPEVPRLVRVKVETAHQEGIQMSSIDVHAGPRHRPSDHSEEETAPSCPSTRPSRARRQTSRQTCSAAGQDAESPAVGHDLRVDRRTMSIGLDVERAEPVCLSLHEAPVFITGRPGSGKSHLLGLIAERLILQRQTTIVLDPEGDHVGLRDLDDVVILDEDRLITPRSVINLVRERVSVVIDLSAIPGPERAERAATITHWARICRWQSGLPDWILVDEAQAIADEFAADLGFSGCCLATYQPDALPPRFTGPGTHRIDVRSHHHAVLHSLDGSLIDFIPASRRTAHVRHQHKYTSSVLPADRGFHFRDDRGSTGSVARNVEQFLDHLEAGGDGVLRHHVEGHDLSRWFRDVFRDEEVAEAIGSYERSLNCANDASDLTVESIRRGIAETVRRRYL